MVRDPNVGRKDLTNELRKYFGHNSFESTRIFMYLKWVTVIAIKSVFKQFWVAKNRAEKRGPGKEFIYFTAVVGIRWTAKRYQHFKREQKHLRPKSLSKKPLT